MLKPDPRVQLIPVDKLRPHDRNPRSITKERFEALQQTLLSEPELLEARPMIALPNGMVVAGNMRQRALEKLFEDSDAAFLRQWPNGAVPVLVRDLDEEQAERWMMLDNNPFGEWEDQALAELIYDHEKRGGNLMTLGFTAERVTQLLDSVDGRKGPNRWPDEPAPAPPKVGRAKQGTIYKLGPHRLMCGDATNPKHVAKLLADAEPRLCVTDPPYGVQLDMSWRRTSQRGPNAKRNVKTATRAAAQYADSIKGDDRVDWSEVLDLVPSLSVLYLWHASSWVDVVSAGIRGRGWNIVQTIVWDKQAFALSRSSYQWRHEAALYAAKFDGELPVDVPWYGPVAGHAIYARKKDTKVPFLGDATQTTIWSAPSPRRRMEGGDEPVDHPTQKPVLLYTRPIQNHTLRGEPIYEPFAGSGSAIIAAEMTGRVCYAIDLDPRFIDVARERYKLFTEEGTTP